MHDLLVEDARRKATLRRGGDKRRHDIDGLALPIELPAEDLLALDEALERLRHYKPRLHELVQLRFFAGLGNEEAARLLGVSARTVKRDWRYVRARLHLELTGGEAEVDDQHA